MPLRRCTGCKDRFEKGDMIRTPRGNFHSFDCAIEYANRRSQRKTQAAANKVKKEKRAQHKTDRERVKPRAKWLAEAQSAVNAWVRYRDRNDGCISCDKPANWHGQWHCSHWRSVAASSATRFNLFNCHKSCSVCNSHLSGNIKNYTPRLIEKIGADRVEWLDTQRQTVKHDVEYLRRLRDVFRKRLRQAKKRGETNIN